MRRSLSVFVAAVIFLLVLSPLSVHAAPPAVRRLILNRDAVSLGVGGTFALEAQVFPSTADHGVTWSSSDESVVTVDEGNLTAHSIGQAEVTVASVSTPSVSVAVQVMVVKPVESITFAEKTIILPRGYTWDQIAYVLPEDATMQRPVWTSSDSRIATVDDYGVITAVANGTCTITAAAADNMGARAVAHVQVRNFEAVITEPGEFDVGFRMSEDSGTVKIVKGNSTTRESWENTVTFEYDRLQKVSGTSVYPVAAGAEIIHLKSIRSGKVISESSHYFFITKSAVLDAGFVPENGSDGGILFRDIPWGLSYGEVKTILSTPQESCRPQRDDLDPDRRRDHIRRFQSLPQRTELLPRLRKSG